MSSFLALDKQKLLLPFVRIHEQASEMKDLAGVKSADRVLDLLEFMASHDGDFSHGDLAERLSIPKSSLTQLLKGLLSRGYVALAPDPRFYRPGPALFSLTRIARKSRSLLEEARPILADLTRQTGESSTLSIRRGWESQVAETCLGSSRLVALLHAGDTAPLYATSGGKALLAHMSDDLQEEYFRQVRFRQITAKTISDINVLRNQIAEVRTTGFAYVDGEYTLGIVGIATPVLDRRGALLGALSFAVPQVRFERIRFVAEAGLRHARAALESRLETDFSTDDVGKHIA